MKINGVKILRGDIWKDEDEGYRRVLEVRNNNILCAMAEDTIEKALVTTNTGLSFTENEILINNWQLIQRGYLADDKDGNPVHIGDIVSDECGEHFYEIIGYMPSFNGDNKKMFIFKNEKEVGGWWVLPYNDIKKVNEKFNIKITLNGKEINPKVISKETWNKLRGE